MKTKSILTLILSLFIGNQILAMQQEHVQPDLITEESIDLITLRDYFLNNPKEVVDCDYFFDKNKNEYRNHQSIYACHKNIVSKKEGVLSRSKILYYKDSKKILIKNLFETDNSIYKFFPIEIEHESEVRALAVFENENHNEWIAVISKDQITFFNKLTGISFVIKISKNIYHSCMSIDQTYLRLEFDPIPGENQYDHYAIYNLKNIIILEEMIRKQKKEKQQFIQFMQIFVKMRESLIKKHLQS